MSKNKKNTQTNSVGYGYGYVVSEDLPNYLRGRFFTLVEALGLKETQEKSLKDLIDNEIWSQFGQSWRSKWITGELHTAVREILEKIEKDFSSKSVSGSTLPTSVDPIKYRFKITYEVV